MRSMCLWLGRRLGLDQSLLHITLHISHSWAAGSFFVGLQGPRGTSAKHPANLGANTESLFMCTEAQSPRGSMGWRFRSDVGAPRLTLVQQNHGSSLGYKSTDHIRDKWDVPKEKLATTRSLVHLMTQLVTLMYKAQNKHKAFRATFSDVLVTCLCNCHSSADIPLNQNP